MPRLLHKLIVLSIGLPFLNLYCIANENNTSLSTQDFTFPLTLSCLMKNKSDPSISVATMFIVEQERATVSSFTLGNFKNIAKGIYKLDAMFSTTTLNINNLTITGTGANSNVFGECQVLK